MKPAAIAAVAALFFLASLAVQVWTTLKISRDLERWRRKEAAE